MNKKRKIRGIYLIQCIKTGKIYVGQGINIPIRFYDHKTKLKKNKHKNLKLQNYYNKFAEENNLEVSHLCKIVRGIRKNHKGWTVINN